MRGREMFDNDGTAVELSVESFEVSETLFGNIR